MSTCCPTDRPQVTSNYQPKELPVYETGDYKSTTAIIFVVDIFGLSPQAKQFADLLASSTGYRVIVPDFFQGKPWSNHSSFDGLMDWLVDYKYEQLKPKIESIEEKLKFQGVQTFYSMGFCWGGKITYQLAQDKLCSKMATCHPSFYQPQDNQVPCPFAILPSKDEAPLLELKEAIESSPFAAQSVFQRFDNMFHGWCGARADWNNEDNRVETQKALEILAKFFKE